MAKTPLLRIYIFSFLLFLLIGCSPTTEPRIEEESTASTVPVKPETVAPTQGDLEPMPATSHTPSPVGLERLIEQTKDDLSQRLSISARQIQLIEATDVEWADSSLGCPQPGMSYPQVITPGYRILLEAGGAQYAYHTNRDTYFVYCENLNPTSP